jgi:hypothetical protein
MAFCGKHALFSFVMAHAPRMDGRDWAASCGYDAAFFALMYRVAFLVFAYLVCDRNAIETTHPNQLLCQTWDGDVAVTM